MIDRCCSIGYTMGRFKWRVDMKVVIVVEAELNDEEVIMFCGRTDEDELGQAELVKDILRDPTQFGTIDWKVKK